MKKAKAKLEKKQQAAGEPKTTKTRPLKCQKHPKEVQSLVAATSFLVSHSLEKLGEAENPIEAVAVVGDSSGNNSHGATYPVGKSQACDVFAQLSVIASCICICCIYLLPCRQWPSICVSCVASCCCCMSVIVWWDCCCRCVVCKEKNRVRLSWIN
ncbi:hypothetical protein WN944_010413 [Citrus x changshan-huyou]|uniref:Uncharacterized protein n=1 Tax=Citrus x changshan-huyou TaxID=2935761 RepID=A0AAP0QX38_9ROSI